MTRPIKPRHIALLVFVGTCLYVLLYCYWKDNCFHQQIFSSQSVFISAFLVPNLKGVVRVVAASSIKPMPTYTCYFAFANGTFFDHSTARAHPLLPDANVNYDGVFVDCPRPNRHSPYYVAVTSNGSSPETLQKIRLKVVPDLTPSVASLAACVCPLHGKLGVRHLIAWIEMNRLLGVEHFIFYNYSSTKELQPVLNHYNKLGLVEVIDWNLNPVPVAELGSWPPPLDKLHYFGQFVSNNDCLYRTKNHFRYVMFADLDELLMPSIANQTLPDLLKSLDHDLTVGFVFRGVYLRTDYEQEKDWRRVLFLRYARRENRVLDKDFAPKLIIKPHIAPKMYIHEVDAGGYFHSTKVLKPSEGLLFHYKSPPRYLFNVSDSGIRDDRVLNYRRSLIMSIERTLDAIHIKS